MCRTILFFKVQKQRRAGIGAEVRVPMSMGQSNFKRDPFAAEQGNRDAESRVATRTRWGRNGIHYQ